LSFPISFCTSYCRSFPSKYPNHLMICIEDFASHCHFSMFLEV
jgi:hypothetical protein